MDVTIQAAHDGPGDAVRTYVDAGCLKHVPRIGESPGYMADDDAMWG